MNFAKLSVVSYVRYKRLLISTNQTIFIVSVKKSDEILSLMNYLHLLFRLLKKRLKVEKKNLFNIIITFSIKDCVTYKQISIQKKNPVKTDAN